MVISVKYWDNNTRKNQIIKAVSLINGLQNYYYLILESLDEDVVNDSCINWDSICENYYPQMMNMSYLLQIRHLMIIGFHMKKISFQ